MEAEEYRLQQAQQSTASFVAKVRALYAGQEEFLSKLGELAPQPAVQPAPDPVDETVSEIDDNVQRLLAQAMMDATAENLKAKQAEDEVEEDPDNTAEFEPVSPEKAYGGHDTEEDREEDEDDEPPVRGSRIDFGQLQFGRDYEIK